MKANNGAAGVDGESIAEFERDLEANPVRALEPALVWELFPAAGARGGDTKEGRLLESARGARGRLMTKQSLDRRNAHTQPTKAACAPHPRTSCRSRTCTEAI